MNPRISIEFRKIWRALDCKASCKSATPYKVYTALLTQNGNNPPVATELQNTLGVTVTYQYTITGYYLAIFSDTVFYSPNEYVVITGDNEITAITAVPVFFNALAINSYSFGPSDNVIGANSPCILEIRKYN